MKRLIIAASLVLSAGVFADSLDDSAQQTNQLSKPQSSKQVSASLANTYTSLTGSPENAAQLASALRTGQSTTITAADGSQTTLTGSGKVMGWGNVNNTLALTSAMMQKNPSLSLQQALTSVTTQRSLGMGWGEIAHSLGLNLGSVVSKSHQANHDLGMHQGLAKNSNKAHQQSGKSNVQNAESRGKSDSSNGSNTGKQSGQNSGGAHSGGASAGGSGGSGGKGGGKGGGGGSK